MKKLIMLIMTVLLANSLFATEQSDDYKMQIGINANVNNYLAFLDDNDFKGIISPGVEAFFDYKLFNNFALNFGLGYNQIKIDYDPILTNSLLNATVRGKLFFIRTKRFSPFLNLGMGFFSYSQENGYFTDSKTSTLLTGGLGVEIPINDKMNLITSINHNIAQDDLDHLPNNDSFLDDEFITVSFGVSFKFGKTKKEEVVPEPIIIEKVEVPPPPPPVEVVEEPVVVEEVVEEVKVVEVAPEPIPEPVVEPEVVEYRSQVYMIKPDDSLIKIAGDVYMNKSLWIKIYNWNKEEIGNNPDLIIPFHELILKDAPTSNLNELTYTFYNHEVTQNESIVDIAEKEYGNKLAWVIIYRDNKDILGENFKYPANGTIIKLRSDVFNQE